jgi:hypothetical protein
MFGFFIMPLLLNLRLVLRGPWRAALSGVAGWRALSGLRDVCCVQDLADRLCGGRRRRASLSLHRWLIRLSCKSLDVQPTPDKATSRTRTVVCTDLLEPLRLRRPLQLISVPGAFRRNASARSISARLGVCAWSLRGGRGLRCHRRPSGATVTVSGLRFVREVFL